MVWMEYSELEELTAKIRALGHPARLGVIFLLKEFKELDVASLQHEVEVSYSDLSRHLKVLAGAGLIGYRKAGTKRLYRLKREAWPNQLESLLDEPSL